MQFQRKLDEKRLDLQIEQSITQQFADDSSSAEDQAGNHLLKDDLEDDMNGLDSNGNSENQQNELLKPHTKVHRYKDWIAKPKAAFTDGQSAFILEGEGIHCRIWCKYMHFLEKSRDQYISVPAHPFATSQLYAHLNTDTHQQAVGLWTRNVDVTIKALESEDRSGILSHRQNQVRAVHFIAKNCLAVDNFKLFWETAEVMDRLYHLKKKETISSTTPLSLMLDTSTDSSSTSDMCVNLRFFSKTEDVQTVLLGLCDLVEGSRGNQLFSALESILTHNGIDFDQILSIATDGDPSMVGHQNGLIAFAKEKNRTIVHVHCGAHRLQLSLRDTFDSDRHPSSKTLIHDAIGLVHRITKSHSRQKAFQRGLKTHNLPSKKLTKPIKTRWSTCHAVISEVLKYSDVLIEVLRLETDVPEEQLYWMNQVNL